ncbi:MAG: endonuclease/exonuclease/phosphatase family protein [Akkermansiaceae bacterium]
MKLLLLFLTTLAATADLRLATFNIRYAGGDKGERSWENRRELVAATIKKMDPDVLGIQEALWSQVTFLEKQFPGYQRVGVGRKDGKKAGEFSPIFFRKEHFELEDSGTFWLSDTPEVAGSITWDNVCERICTWAKLKRKSDQKTITILNTHWDHRGQKSRERSAKLIFAYFKAKPNLILMGDFNATETNPALKKLKGAGYTNAFLSLHQASQDRGTFHPWNGKGKPTGTIDHIFYQGDFSVKKSWIERHHEGTKWPSDHFPVAAILKDS